MSVSIACNCDFLITHCTLSVVAFTYNLDAVICGSRSRKRHFSEHSSTFNVQQSTTPWIRPGTFEIRYTYHDPESGDRKLMFKATKRTTSIWLGFYMNLSNNGWRRFPLARLMKLDSHRTDHTNKHMQIFQYGSRGRSPFPFKP